MYNALATWRVVSTRLQPRPRYLKSSQGIAFIHSQWSGGIAMQKTHLGTSRHDEVMPTIHPFTTQSYRDPFSKKRNNNQQQLLREIESELTRPDISLLGLLESKSKSKLASHRVSQIIARKIMSQLGASIDRETLHIIFRNLILSQTAPDGSIARVIKYLGELHAEGLEIVYEDCIAILKVLAVHPDFILRTQVLRYMETSWLVLGEEVEHFAVAGLFRDLQLERAMAGLVSMKERGLKVEKWLFDLALAILASQEEMDSVLELLRMRNMLYVQVKQNEFDVSLLNKAVAKHHLELAKVICTALDATKYKLSSELLTSLLKLASSQMDIEFAKQLLQWHQQLHGSLASSHYTAIVDMLLRAGLLNEAMESLHYMSENGLEINEAQLVHAIDKLLVVGDSTLKETEDLLP